MGRKPKVTRKAGYWYSQAGGKARYLGRCDEVPEQEATARLWTALAGLSEDRGPVRRHASGITVEALRDLFLAWLTEHRSPKTVKGRRLHLQRFAARFPGRHAESIRGEDVEQFIAGLRSQGYHVVYIEKFFTSVRAMFRKGVKMGWLDASVDPFVRVEAIRLPARVLREADLPTADEVRRLFEHADGSLRDMLTLFLHTGARTIEVAEMTVGDYQPATRTVVLGRHKRSMTMKDPVPRIITLNEEADAVLRRLTAGRGPHEPVILSGWKRPYRPQVIANRFQNLRRRAGVRDHITPYSFRHLFVTDCLQAGLDSALVGKMLGTSPDVIMKVYAHWRTDAFRDAMSRVDAMRALRRGEDSPQRAKE
ncbi:tyrosine-type recombinase/integrase [Paludisphaera mucosa]|uniref:Tyrosine-type recombinase/integrase n=1 Tax=Paludisphaera mucosa TaxID=3030827 RepID=A0ABT6F4T9_9BACT|nr:tyrosine-type recombinase/integrase [Paludisphaera mucosa]MDG3002585.1 tyrosine-type recombinase/integrase [Paludisphaera mucosa]